MRTCVKCGGSWSGAKQFDTECTHDFDDPPEPAVAVAFLRKTMELGYRAHGPGPGSETECFPFAEEHPTREGAIATWQAEWTRRRNEARVREYEAAARALDEKNARVPSANETPTLPPPGDDLLSIGTVVEVRRLTIEEVEVHGLATAKYVADLSTRAWRVIGHHGADGHKLYNLAEHNARTFESAQKATVCRSLVRAKAVTPTLPPPNPELQARAAHAYDTYTNGFFPPATVEHIQRCADEIADAVKRYAPESIDVPAKKKVTGSKVVDRDGTEVEHVVGEQGDRYTVTFDPSAGYTVKADPEKREAVPPPAPMCCHNRFSVDGSETEFASGMRVVVSRSGGSPIGGPGIVVGYEPEAGRFGVYLIRMDSDSMGAEPVRVSAERVLMPRHEYERARLPRSI